MNTYKSSFLSVNNESSSGIICQDPTAIDTYLHGGRLSILLTNSYIDFEDYDSVIKTYLDNHSYKTTKDFQKEAFLYVRENKAVLHDDLIQYGQNKEHHFYSVERTKTDFEDQTGTAKINVYLTMDNHVYNYERTVFSLLDLTGLIGGAFELCEILGGIFVGYFSQKLLNFSMLSRLYQIQYNENEEMICRTVPNTTFVAASNTKVANKPVLYEEHKMPHTQLQNERRKTVFNLHQSKLL